MLVRPVNNACMYQKHMGPVPTRRRQAGTAARAGLAPHHSRAATTRPNPAIRCVVIAPANSKLHHVQGGHESSVARAGAAYSTARGASGFSQPAQSYKSGGGRGYTSVYGGQQQPRGGFSSARPGSGFSAGPATVASSFASDTRGRGAGGAGGASGGFASDTRGRGRGSKWGQGPAVVTARQDSGMQ